MTTETDPRIPLLTAPWTIEILINAAPVCPPGAGASTKGRHGAARAQAAVDRECTAQHAALEVR